jgi:hypothetical protein
VEEVAASSFLSIDSVYGWDEPEEIRTGRTLADPPRKKQLLANREYFINPK